jgi:hypothetical protein
MALNADWVQALLKYEVTLTPPDQERDPGYPGSESHCIGRAWIDGALVVYDLEDPPKWLIPVLNERDDDTGDTDPRLVWSVHPE